MQPIAQVAHLPLEWKQPSARKMEYILTTDEQEVATLQFRSSFGSYATGASADGCWTFKRTGFWKRQATIRRCEQEQDIGIFRDNTWMNGGTLTLGERTYKLTTNTWMNKFEVLDEQENVLLRFKLGGVIRSHADVEIVADEEPHLTLLTLFGWYIIVMLVNESSAVAAIVAAS